MAFDSVSADNFSHLSGIASVVQHSVGVSVREECKGVREREEWAKEGKYCMRKNYCGKNIFY